MGLGRFKVGFTDNIMKNNMYIIYSWCFISGKPADLLDDTNQDWFPTQNLGCHCTVLKVGVKEFKASTQW